MRILFVANTLPPHDVSGVGEQVLQLATGLRERGHEVEIFYAAIWSPTSALAPDLAALVDFLAAQP